jgi:hypothetical protein
LAAGALRRAPRSSLSGVARSSTDAGRGVSMARRWWALPMVGGGCPRHHGSCRRDPDDPGADGRNDLPLRRGPRDLPNPSRRLMQEARVLPAARRGGRRRNRTASSPLRAPCVRPVPGPSTKVAGFGDAVVVAPPPRYGSRDEKAASTAGRSAEACSPPDDGPLRSMPAGDSTCDGIAPRQRVRGLAIRFEALSGPAIAPGPLSHDAPTRWRRGARRAPTRPRSPSARARGDHRGARCQEMPREVPNGRSSHGQPSSNRAQQSSSPALAW